jgi:hypothetical protein
MTPRQSRIPLPRQQLPEPKDYECEWCAEPTQATQRFERRAGAKHLGTAQFVFACDKHADTAARALQKPERKSRL